MDRINGSQSLAAVSLEGYLLFFGALVVLMGVVFWWLRRKETDERQQFFEQFNSDSLRMSPQKVGLVYRVISEDADYVTVLPVWDGKAAVRNGSERRVPRANLIPFDPDRFFW